MRDLVHSLESRCLLSAAAITAKPQFQTGDISDARAVYNFGGPSAVFSKTVDAKVTHSGTLVVTGTSRADRIIFTVKNGKAVASGGDQFSRKLQLSAGGPQYYTLIGVPLTGVKRVVVNGLGGDDTITVRSDVSVTVRGARGDDMIAVFAPTRKIDGGSGTDNITSENLLG